MKMNMKMNRSHYRCHQSAIEATQGCGATDAVQTYGQTKQYFCKVIALKLNTKCIFHMLASYCNIALSIADIWGFCSIIVYVFVHLCY